MNVTLRPARAEDAHEAVPLLYSAGERLLREIFGDGDKRVTLSFLQHAWLHQYGQYGYANHWVACENYHPVGLITCWHDELADDFDHQTLVSITDFFGTQSALNIIERSQPFSAALHSPQPSELGIGHVAVHPDFQHRGIATMLMRSMEDEARTRDKKALVLDVENDNHLAFAFYRHLGYQQAGGNAPFLHMIKPLLSRMELTHREP
jgi:ribosomal protein S18 acetylase RimI-like enzyme